MAQDTDFVWNQTPILEYEDAKEYRFQTLTTYSTVEGVYIYYVSDDDTMKTA